MMLFIESPQFAWQFTYTRNKNKNNNTMTDTHQKFYN